MKKHRIYPALAAAVLALGFASCADLGFGVDVDATGPGPYFYGTTGFDYNNWGPWYGDPAWTWWPSSGYYPGPVYRPRPPQSAPTAPSLPSFRPPSGVNTRPSINGLPTTILGTERPGNLGRPTPGGSQPKPIQPRGR